MRQKGDIRSSAAASGASMLSTEGKSSGVLGLVQSSTSFTKSVHCAQTDEYSLTEASSQETLSPRAELHCPNPARSRTMNTARMFSARLRSHRTFAPLALTPIGRPTPAKRINSSPRAKPRGEVGARPQKKTPATGDGDWGFRPPAKLFSAGLSPWITSSAASSARR